jgi:hypothetical protein
MGGRAWLADLQSIDYARLAFWTTVIFAGTTFWLVPRLPMSDLPQHAAQVAIWGDLLQGTSNWQSLLYVNYFTPYLVGYSFALLLSFIAPVSVALKLVLTVAYCGFVAACVLLRARFRGDRRLDWLFVPCFFGFSYVWGLYTFMIAVPLGVLFILLAHHYTEKPTLRLAIALCLANLVLFFSHGLVFLFANAIGVAFLVLGRRRLTRIVPTLLPYVVLGLWCVAYSLVRLPIENAASSGLLEVDWGWDIRRLKFFIYPMGMFKADWIFGPLLLLMLSAPFVLRARLNLQNSLSFVPMGVTLLVWAFAPFMAMNVAHIYARFAVFFLPAYALMFCAHEPSASLAPRTSVPKVLVKLWLPLLCWTFLAIHVERLLAFGKESAAFDEVLAATQLGQRALGLVLDPASAATGNLVAYEHFPLWYQAEKKGFVDFNFAGYPPQIVRFRIDRAPAVSVGKGRLARNFNWTQYQAEIYRYFFVRHTAPLPETYFPAGPCKPVLIKSVGSWSVFENVNCYMASS